MRDSTGASSAADGSLDFGLSLRPSGPGKAKVRVLPATPRPGGAGRGKGWEVKEEIPGTFSKAISIYV